MTRVELRGISKRFGSFEALKKIDLDIRSGELFSILGPSGCGKTTLLRIIAGLEVPTSGRIYFDGEDVTDLKPYERNASMVFQNYALWPHMTVFENIAFGLKAKGLPDNEIRRRVRDVLELVKLEGLENRLPLQLSGGQQQRVALARALVVEPRILLLDEPLSNLDAGLRIEMREEIRRIQKSLKITTIYVTHDQVEAMGVSDRVAVMSEGRIIQVGSPIELYYNPNSLFTARFIGRGSILYGIVSSIEDNLVKISIERSMVEISIRAESSIIKNLNPGSRVGVLIRPEAVILNPQYKGEDTYAYNSFEGIVDLVMFTGDKTEIHIDVDGLRILAYSYGEFKYGAGSRIKIYIDPSKIKIIQLK